MSDGPDQLPRDRYIPTGELLGEGGMAKVWRAWHRERGVWCAVKILRPRYAMVSAQRRRFLNEAHILLGLQHRNVVAALEVGEGEYPFLVMEVADGGTLNRWVHTHGPMPARMAVGVAIQICKGLAAAHRIGVVHRDIKPHNVLINRKGVCKISDFGIARLPRADGSADVPDASTVSSSDAMGTLGYMAPEQRSDPKRADPRTDVYGVAATLFDLLTGRPQMNLFMAGQDRPMLVDIPEVLRPILVKSAEYDPNNRYADVRDLAEALYAIRDELEPLSPGAPGLADGLPPEPPPPPGALHTTESGEGRLDDLEVPTFTIRTATGFVADTPDTTRSDPGEPVERAPASVPPGRGSTGVPAPPRRERFVVPQSPSGLTAVEPALAPAWDPVASGSFPPPARAPGRTPDSTLSSRSPNSASLLRIATVEPDEPEPSSISWRIVVSCGAGLLLGFWWMWWWVSQSATLAERSAEVLEAALVSEGPVVDRLVELGAERSELTAAHDAITRAASSTELAHLVPGYLGTLDRAREHVKAGRPRDLVEVDRQLTTLRKAGMDVARSHAMWSMRCAQVAGKIADLLGAPCPPP